MSPRWRVAVGIVAALVIVDLALHFIGTLTGGTPGGPESSSYATKPDGARAYAELLGRYGHRVDRVRTTPGDATLDPTTTLFLLGAAGVRTADAAALRRFVESGGQLVAGGPNVRWVRSLVSAPPHGTAARARFRARRLHVQSAGGQVWTNTGGFTPVARSPRVILAVTKRVGRGRLILLADPSPLQNRLLDRADNAAFGLSLAGEKERPTSFLESYHGDGRSSGLTALPLAWKLLLAGLALATFVWMIARGRRFGPP